MQPNIDTFLQEQPDVKYVRIDVDENAGISREMEVQSVPTLIAYNNGESTRNVGSITTTVWARIYFDLSYECFG